MVDDDAIGRVLLTEQELDRRVRELGAEASRDYDGKDLLQLGILKGAVLFLSDLIRAIRVPAEVDFMAVESYGSATKSSGVVRVLKDLDKPIEGRDVLIVEVPVKYVGFEIPNRVRRRLRARLPTALPRAPVRRDAEPARREMARREMTSYASALMRSVRRVRKRSASISTAT